MNNCNLGKEYQLPIFSSDKTATPSDQTAQNISRIKLGFILMLKIPPLSIVTEYTITVLKKQRHRLYYKTFWYFRQEKQIYSIR